MALINSGAAGQAVKLASGYFCAILIEVCNGVDTDGELCSKVLVSLSSCSVDIGIHILLAQFALMKLTAAHDLE